MTDHLRRPAVAPPPVRTAVPRSDNPQILVQQHYQHVWQTRMRDMPFVNAVLEVDAIGFVRHDGDWLGAIVTPWFLNLFLFHGGGRLWQDISAGQRRRVELPCGTLEFIADDDPDMGLYQYCPLMAAVGTLPDHATARQAALDALQMVFTPAQEPDHPQEARARSSGLAEQDANEASRRGFFRKIGGRG